MISANKVYKNLINQFESEIIKQTGMFDKGKVSKDALIRYNVYDRYLFKNISFVFNDGKYYFKFNAKVGTKIDRNTIFTEVKRNKIFIGIGSLDFHFIESDDGIRDRIEHLDFYDVSNPKQFDPYDCLMINGEKTNEYVEKVKRSLCDTSFSIKFIDSKKFFPSCSGNMIPFVVIDTDKNRYGYYDKRLSIDTKGMIYQDLSNGINSNIVGNTPDSMFLLSVGRFGENLSR